MIQKGNEGQISINNKTKKRNRKEKITVVKGIRQMKKNAKDKRNQKREREKKNEVEGVKEQRRRLREEEIL